MGIFRSYFLMDFDVFLYLIFRCFFDSRKEGIFGTSDNLYPQVMLFFPADPGRASAERFLFSGLRAGVPDRSPYF